MKQDVANGCPDILEKERRCNLEFIYATHESSQRLSLGRPSCECSRPGIEVVRTETLRAAVVWVEGTSLDILTAFDPGEGGPLFWATALRMAWRQASQTCQESLGHEAL